MSKGKRGNLRRIRGGNDAEYTPGKAANELTDQEHRERLGEKGDKDGTDHGDQGAEDGPVVAQLVGDPAADQDTKECANGGSLSCTRLPRSRDLVTALLVDVFTKSFSKGFLSVYV